LIQYRQKQENILVPPSTKLLPYAHITELMAAKATEHEVQTLYDHPR